MRILAIAVAAAIALLAAASAAPAPRASAPCPGTAVKVFDNTNTGGVTGGGKAPTFDTKGKSYCLTQIVTYHWNGGHGKTPGSVGLSSTTMSATATAQGGAGQGAPPASVSHTYAKAGTYAAYLVVAQQQKYGGVQYTAPRGGLAVSVG